MPRTNKRTLRSSTKSTKNSNSNSTNDNSNSNSTKTPTGSKTAAKKNQRNEAPSINIDMESDTDDENEESDTDITATTKKTIDNETSAHVYDEWHSNSLLRLKVDTLSNLFVNAGFVQGYMKIGCQCLIFDFCSAIFMFQCQQSYCGTT